MRKDDNDLALRLLHSINGNLSPTMAMDALKEIRAQPDKRQYQNALTGMRNFPTAVQDLDEVWRAIFSQGLIRPVAHRQPGGVRVEDVSLAEYDNEEAFIAATKDCPFFTLDQVLAESNCWNCRGFGHVRRTCPSSNGTRSMGHIIQALSSISQQKPKAEGQGKGRGKGAQGRGGQGRSAAGRGNGAIAVYLEDDHLWSLDGAYVTTTVAALNIDAHDEEAHTALTTRAADVCPSSDYYDDGDEWMDKFDDTNPISYDTANVATVARSKTTMRSLTLPLMTKMTRITRLTTHE